MPSIRSAAPLILQKKKKNLFLCILLYNSMCNDIYTSKSYYAFMLPFFFFPRPFLCMFVKMSVLFYNQFVNEMNSVFFSIVIIVERLYNILLHFSSSSR
jgi:hypothetical protein